MKYETIYKQIIERAKTRKLTGYKEKHHILPTCMNGNNDKENLVELTAKEHFICHKLLTELYPTENKLHYAVRMMATMKSAFGRDYKVGAREYQRLKENIVVSNGTREKIRIYALNMTNEHKRRIGDSCKNPSLETRMKMKMAKLGKSLSNEHKEKIRIASSNITEETREKMSIATKNRPLMSEETREKISITLSGRKQKKSTCPYCGHVGGVSAMKRYHFNNCKHKGNNHE